MIEEITSLKNPKILHILKLKKANKRKEEGLTLVEGSEELKLAIKAGVKIKTVFACEAYAYDRSVLKNISSGAVFYVNKNVFDKISYRENPSGLIAIIETPQKSLKDLKLKESPLLVILESVEKPGNLGAVLRTADCINADAVIISDPKTDIYNPNSIRASLGAVFTNQVVSATNQEVFEFLKNNKIKSYAATPSAKDNYTDQDFRGASAIVIGTEHEGLSKEWLDFADQKILIPMKGRVNSLNASVSAAVILFEAARQRS